MPLVLVLCACLSARPARAAVDQGRPACDYCRMIFTDTTFGGQITLRGGGSRIYDAIECLAAAVLTDSVPQRDIRTITVTRHDRPSERLGLDRAVLLHCPDLESPMGLSLVAFATRAAADSGCPGQSGRLLDWRGALGQVNAKWFQGRLAVASHAATHAPRAAPRAAKPR